MINNNNNSNNRSVSVSGQANQSQPEKSIMQLITEKKIAKNGLTKNDFAGATKKVRELFKIMECAFKDQWTKKYSNEESLNLWTITIIDLSNEQIANGILEIEKEGLQFPPTPYRFKELCLGKQDDSFKLQDFSQLNSDFQRRQAENKRLESK